MGLRCSLEEISDLTCGILPVLKGSIMIKFRSQESIRKRVCRPFHSKPFGFGSGFVAKTIVFSGVSLYTREPFQFIPW